MSVPVTNQKKEIKAANILLCMFIVIHHVLHMTIQEIPADIIWKITYFIYNILSIGIYSAVLICGVCLAYSFKDDSGGSRHIRYVKDALIPYLIAILAYWVILFVFGETELDPSLLIVHIISGNLTTHFFLPIVIIQFIILFPLVQRLFNKFRAPVVLIIALMLNAASVLLAGRFKFLNSVFINYIYAFLVGSYAGLNYDKFKKLLIDNFRAILIGYIAITLILEIFVYPSGMEFKAVLKIINLVFHPFAAIFWVALCIKITSLSSIKRLSVFCNMVSSSTYYIYLWYAIFLLITNMYIHMSETATVMAGFAIRSAVTMFGVAVVILIRQLAARRRIKED